MNQVISLSEQADERADLPSASSFRRLELCPGSYQLSLKAKELGQAAHQRPTPYAESGTRIHAWLAGETVELSSDELVTAEFLLERASEQRARIFGEAETLELKEKRLWLTLGGKPVLSGRFDRALYTPSLALVQDFKTGWVEPDPAEQNAQLKVLAVSVALNLPTLREVVVQVISGPFGVFEARYTIADLARAYNEIVLILKAATDPYAPLNPGPQACRYCPAILICQAVKDRIMPTVNMLGRLPEGETAAKLLDEVAVLQTHLDEIREYYTNRCNSDPIYTVPGYAMVPGNSRREITDWERALERLAEWLEPAELKAAANYRLTELEKVLGSKLSLKGKALKERFNQILTGLIEEKQAAPSLKRVRALPKSNELLIA